MAALIAALPFAGSAQKEKVAENYDEIVHNIGKMVEYIHYEPKAINDDFSKKIFTTFFETLDPGKFIFIKSDIDSFKRWETLLDNEIMGEKLTFFKTVNTIYRARITESQDLAIRLLKQPFTFDKDEKYNSDRDSLQFPKSLKDKEDVWRRYMTYSVLNTYDDLLDDSIANKLGSKIDTAVERKAREYVTRAQQRNFKRLLDGATEQENFGQYVNTIVHLMDPHSGYFLPVDRREFQESLSGIYYGIGAVLQETETGVKVSEPMIGAPEKWPQYEGLQLSGNDYAGNWLKVALWHGGQQMKDL
ncbi:MAG: hypothetical protein EOP49_25810, partial [Sphingobacteriales bacterium]